MSLLSAFVLSVSGNCTDGYCHSIHSFEKNYDPIPVLDWMRNNPMVPVAAVVLYGVLIMAGQYVMQNRPSWNWRRLMAFWNLGLSVFSWIGMARTLPQLAHNLYYMSLRDNLCTDRKYFVPMDLVSCHSEVDGYDFVIAVCRLG